MRATGATVGPGSVVGGRYRLGRVLGSGAMADVYDGVDLRLERAVAVKLLRPEMVVRDDVRSRFEAEARAAAGLSHPNAVAVFDTGEHEGAPFLVMERLPGETLADRIAAGPVDQAWLCRAARGVLGALAAAHAAGIVHRDVKPGNILIAADGTAKIADFGIAKSVTRDDEDGSGAHRLDLTATGQLLGTPAYLAPERIEGVPAGPRADLWALGVVLYEALAGQKPFGGEAPLDVAQAIVNNDHVPLAERRPDADPRLVAAIQRAMAPDPADRFATAQEMASALGGAGADPTVDGRDGTLVLPAGTLHPLDRPKARRDPRQWVPLVLIGGLLLLLVLALAGRDRPGASSPSSSPSAPPSTTAAPTTTAAAAPTAEQVLAAALRDLAGSLDSGRDGARAGDLAAGLRRVADDVEAGSPAAGPNATGVIVAAATWTQAGQLGPGALAAAVDLLRQVPGVRLPSFQTPAAPQPTVAPSDAPRENRGNNGRGRGQQRRDDD